MRDPDHDLTEGPPEPYEPELEETYPYIPKPPPEPDSAYPYNAGSPWSPFLAPVSLSGCYGLIWLLAIILIVAVVVSIVL